MLHAYTIIDSLSIIDGYKISPYYIFARSRKRGVKACVAGICDNIFFLKVVDN